MKDVNKHIIKAAFNLARKHKAGAVFLHVDPLDDLLFEEKWPWKFDLYFVSKKRKWELKKDKKKALESRAKDVIAVPRTPLTRASILKFAVLLALSSGKIEHGEKVVAVTGTTEQGILDSIQFVDTSTETEIISGKVST